MSESIRSLTGSDELRRRFAVWSLAIFGTLSGSGSVRLESSIWAADDPPAGSTANPAAQTEKSQDKPADVNREELSKLIAAKQFDEAKAMVDAAMAANPSDINLYHAYLLASSMSATLPDEAAERLKSIVEEAAKRQAESNASPSRIALTNGLSALVTLYNKRGENDKAIELLKEFRERSSQFKDRSARQTINSLLARNLHQASRVAEAEELVRADVEDLLSKAEAEDAPAGARQAVGSAVSNYGSLFSSTHADKFNTYRDRAERILARQLESDQAKVADFSAYMQFKVAIANGLADTDPDAASKMLEELQGRADEFSTKLGEGDQRLLKSLTSLIKSSLSRMEAKRLHVSLIGQPAPEFDIAETVEMSKVNWQDLKGKVVLIDFWAVWCGPCIATFPHLREWQKEFGDKGFVIVGVTRQYGYSWDEEAKRAKSNKEATLEDELAMLAKFRESHELLHGFVVTPKDSEYSKKFGVTGIPQAVLVDQNGVVQMIRVGSGEKNAHDLENKIRSLLGESKAPESKAAGS